MSDIVERLRKRSGFFVNGGVWLMGVEPDKDCQEAADEIERLRSLVGKADVGQSFTDMMSKVARRSVEPDEPPWDT